VAEILREKIIRHLGQEVPYSAAVEIESFKYENGKAWIQALIWVEKEGQKAIVIGNKGEVLKRIATLARLDMEKLLDQKVILKVWVKVKENWSDNERILLSLVYKHEN
jgi:GTP-binding protein Era